MTNILQNNFMSKQIYLKNAEFSNPDPNELQFLFDLNGAKTFNIGDKKSISRQEFYGKILEKIATTINKEEKTNHKVYFISFDDKGLKYAVKGDNIIQYQEDYFFLIQTTIYYV